MADNKLNYQQARQVRKSRFSDMFLDQLAQKETGVLGAVGKTISLRSQARIKGIKEKFDPLNIVKFMTMGSRFGPALFGKLTGRNQKDIDYFTGRTKSVVGTRNTADKLKKVGGDGDSEGINQQLSKIFSFLKNSRDEDVRLKQLAKNFDEELSMEKEKRHKEMIKTLEKLMKQINSGGKVTAEPVQPNFMDGIWDNIKGLAEILGEMRKFIVEIAKKIGLPLAKGLMKVGKFGLRMLPSVAAAATAGAVIYGADYLAGEVLGVGKNADGTDIVIDGEKDDQNYSKFSTAEKIESGIARGIEKVGDIIAPNVANEARAKRIENETEYLKLKAEGKVGQTAEAQAPEGMIFDPEGNVTPLPSNKSQAPKPAATVITPPAGGTTPNLRPTMQNDPRLITPSSATPSAPSPVSSAVSSLTNNNIDLNLTNTNSTTASKSVVNNTTNVSNKQQGSGLKPNQISVRNDEPTFMRLIQDATRLV